MAFQLRDYQGDAVSETRIAFRTVKGVLLVMATGAGKCLAKGTPVMMFDGTIKLVEDIKIGDLLMGPDSQPRRVESLAQGKEMMYRVEPVKGDAYTVNESHILSLRLTKTSSTRNKRITAGDGQIYNPGDIVNISVTDYLRSSTTFKHCAKGWRAPVDFQGGNALPIPPYILGVWLGDGLSHQLGFTLGDEPLLDEVRSYAHAIGMDTREEFNSPGSTNIYLRNKYGKTGRGGSKFGNGLRSLNLWVNKHVPHIYLTGNRFERLELLAGILDTDGHNSGKGYDLTLKSEALLDGVVFIARSLGFSAYKKKVKKQCGKGGPIGDYFSCHINGGIDEIPCRLERKQANPRKQVKNVLNTGITVEPSGWGEYYGFELSGPDRLFLLGDFTVTHNTVVFCEIAKNAALKGRRVLVLAHRDLLIKQASSKMGAFGIPHGIIMAGNREQYHHLVQVASIQSLARRLKKCPFKPDIIVIDEAHLSAAATYHKILEAFPDAKVLGVTGSPCRLDNKPLGREYGGHFDRLIQVISIGELIRRGFLVRPRYFVGESRVNTSQFTTKMGDYNQQQVEEAMDTPALNGDAVKQYKAKCYGKPGIAWCVTIAHATHVAEEFTKAGIPCEVLCGEDDDERRADVLGRLARRELLMVAFVGILIEGVDVPEIEVIILLRLSMSLSSYLQVIGRGLRPAPGKDCCYVLDHAGMIFEHGPAEIEREWSLDSDMDFTENKSAAASSLIQCGKCFYVFYRGEGKEAGRIHRLNNPQSTVDMVCPDCGAEIERVVALKLDHSDENMLELTPEMLRKRQKDAEKEEARRRSAAKRKETARAETLDELRVLAAERGYKPQWADRMLEARMKKVYLQIEQEQQMLKDRVERLIAAFGAFGVNEEQLEGHMGIPVGTFTMDDVSKMRVVYAAIKAGASVLDYFKPQQNGDEPQYF